jgi:hypothetical protein
MFTWSFGLSWLLLRGLAGLIHAWERSGLEFGAPPQPVGVDEEVSSTQEKPEAGVGEGQGLLDDQGIRDQEIGPAASAPQA